MYLGKNIDNALSEIKPKLIGTKTLKHFKYLLKNAIEPFGVDLVIEKSPDISFLVMSGLYCPIKNLPIVIISVPKGIKHNIIDYEFWPDFKFGLSQVIQHELIHKSQFQYRDEEQINAYEDVIDYRAFSLDLEEEKEYLANTDEIDAYGHDIAMEILYFYKDQDPYDILRTINKKRKIWSYSYYKKTFGKDNWDRVKKRLLKKAYLWLPYTTIK